MLKLMPPAYTFRGDYQYNNITFIPAAMIIEKLTGKSWEENVRERIFKPLGMDESTLNGEGFGPALADGRAALPYAFERKGREMNIWPMYTFASRTKTSALTGSNGSKTTKSMP